MPRVTMPTTGIIGADPAKTAKSLRVDFAADDFVLAIEEKGYRVIWERAAWCPCKPFSKETSPNADPDCPKCGGVGFFWFAPLDYQVDPAKVGKLDELQQFLADRNRGAIIKGIMTNLQATQKGYEQVGNWADGTTRITVQPENQLGYMDRIINIDTPIVYFEKVMVKNPGAPLKLRYPVVQVNNIETMTKRWRPGQFSLTNDGLIVWANGQRPGQEYVSVSYTIYPQWLIVDHPHVVRASWERKKTKPNKLQTPIGNLQKLALHGYLKYDFKLLDVNETR